MSTASKVISNPGFKSWYIETMIKMIGTATAESEAVVRNRVENNLNAEINEIYFVLNAFFPETRPDPKHRWMFITDEIEHHMFEFGIEARGGTFGYHYPGRAFIYFNGIEPRISFPDVPGFKHGHVAEDGHITCHGGYAPTYSAANASGFAGALAELHLFCSKSRYGTKSPVPVLKTPKKREEVNVQEG